MKYLISFNKVISYIYEINDLQVEDSVKKFSPIFGSSDIAYNVLAQSNFLIEKE